MSGGATVLLLVTGSLGVVGIVDARGQEAGCDSEHFLLQQSRALHQHVLQGPTIVPARAADCKVKHDLEALVAELHKAGLGAGDRASGDGGAECREALEHLVRDAEGAGAALCAAAVQPSLKAVASDSGPRHATSVLQSGALMDEVAREMRDIVAGTKQRAAARQAELDDSIASITACSSAMVAGRGQLAAEARRQHSECRAGEATLKTQADRVCGDFESYWRNLRLPNCTRDRGSGDWRQVLACVREAGGFTEEAERQLLSRSGACRSDSTAHRAKRALCNETQAAFEAAVCSSIDASLAVCPAYEVCYADGVDAHERLVASVADLQASDELAFEAAEDILCSLRVLNETDTAKRTEIMAECNALQLDMDALNVTFPAVPAQGECDTSEAEARPCDEDWTQAEYGNQSWATQAPPQACRPCCGDGVLVAGERCDDGNAMDGDGCSAACFTERRVVAPDAIVQVGGVAWMEPNVGNKMPALTKVNDSSVAACWAHNLEAQWCQLFGVSASGFTPLGTRLDVVHKLAHVYEAAPLLQVQPGWLIRVSQIDGGRSLGLVGLIVNGSQLQEGSLLSLGDAEDHGQGFNNPSAAGLSGGRAVVCHEVYYRKSVKCQVVSSQDGLTYQQGPTFKLSRGAGNHGTGLLGVGPDTAIVCWYNDEVAFRMGMCRVLRATGVSLAWDGEAVVMPHAWGSLSSIRGLSPRVAVVCSDEYCAPLAINGSITTFGQQRRIGPALAQKYGRFDRISEDHLAWCGHIDPNTTCRLMQARNNTLTMGELVEVPDVKLHWNGMGQEVLALADLSALLCYNDRSGDKRECRFLTVPTVWDAG